jgi:hypothetical protein
MPWPIRKIMGATGRCDTETEAVDAAALGSAVEDIGGAAVGGEDALTGRSNTSGAP